MTGSHIVRSGPTDNWRQVAHAAPALAEPITVAERWKNRRGESIRLVLNRFEGRNIFDLRTWCGADGKLKPGKGGFTAEVKHLPRLAAAFARAEAKARELGLVGARGRAMSEAAIPRTAARERLPDRRASETFSFELDGVRYHATVGLYSDGRPGEIFISSHKAGSATDVAARDAAIAISVALQFGARLEDIARALSRDNSRRANGPAGRALDLLSAERGA